MSQISSNSEQFPPPPVVTLDLPEGWVGVPMPDAILSCRGPLVDGRAPIIAIRYATRPAGFGLGDALREVENAARKRPDGEVEEPFRAPVGDLELVGVNASWTDPAIGDVVQVHMFAGSRSNGLLRLLHITGTVGGESIEEDYEAVQGVLETLRIAS